jgi:hypothetical protein
MLLNIMDQRQLIGVILILCNSLLSLIRHVKNYTRIAVWEHHARMNLGDKVGRVPSPPALFGIQ